jgi:putative tryptophan/tyrosine transport system substrate-binding protein
VNPFWILDLGFSIWRFKRKKLFCLAMGVLLLVLYVSAEGQQPAKVRRIGFLASASPSVVSHRVEAFQQGLRDLGYIEGKNIVIESRYAEGKFDQIPALMAELVRLKVEILVSGGPIPTRAAKAATTTIPIVMTQDTDPVGNGFVASLARPGGNITGLSTLTPELSGKRLELLKEILPKLSRVAVFGTSTMPGHAQSLREIELAAGTFKVQVQHLDVVDHKDIETAFRAARTEGADAILTLNSPIFSSHQLQLAELAIRNRLPIMYNRPDYVEAGGLMTYSVNLLDLDRRAATYVDRILKGAKPGELPVEQPTKFELVINLKAAKQIGITIPPTVLERADSFADKFLHIVRTCLGF